MIAELITPSIVGIVCGLVSGLIPGMGNFASLIIIFPYLVNLEPAQILVLYVALTTISQFIGSIPAITFGIPGESSSVPAVIESRNLKSPQQIYQAIVGSAVGSAFGGGIVLFLTWLAIDWLMYSVHFFNSMIQFFIYCLVMLSMILIFKENKYWVNVLMILIGLGLGLIGYNTWAQTSIMTFGNMSLFQGLPMVVVVVMLLGIPEILKNYATKLEYKNSEITSSGFRFNWLKSSWYSLIGFFGGLTPGLTTTMSSQLAWIEAKRHKENTAVDRIVASETANNAGAFSQLLPMILLGIPLLGSEALVLGLMEGKGFKLNEETFKDVFIIVSVSLVFINLVGLCLAWPLARHIIKIFQFNIQKIYIILMCVFVAMVVWVGYINYQTLYYVITAICLFPLAYVLRNKDTMPLIFAFLIHDRIIDAGYRLYVLYW